MIRKFNNLLFIIMLFLLMVSCAGSPEMTRDQDDYESKGLIYIRNGKGVLTVTATGIPTGYSVSFYYSEDKWDNLSNWSEIKLPKEDATSVTLNDANSGKYYYFTRVFDDKGKMVSPVYPISSLTDTFRVYNSADENNKIQTTVTITVNQIAPEPPVFEATVKPNTPETELRNIYFTDMRSGANVCTYGYYERDGETPITFPITKAVPAGSAGPYYADDFDWLVSTKRPERKDLKYVEINFPNTNEIPEYFLQGYSELREVVVTSDIKKVGKLAFDGCKHLSSIAFDEGIEEIGEAAFHACAEMESITLPSSLTQLGKDAFSECYSLETFNSPGGQNQEGNHFLIRNNIMMAAAPGHRFDASELEIPYGVHEIGPMAFWHHDEIQSISLPDSLDTIGDYAFAFCSNLESIFHYDKNKVSGKGFPPSLLSIGTAAFSYCTELKPTMTVTESDLPVTYATENEAEKNFLIIPSSVKTIGQYAFYRCSSLENVLFKANPDIDRTIPAFAFCGCLNLRHVYAENVTSIEGHAFGDCKILEKVFLMGNESDALIDPNMLANTIFCALYRILPEKIELIQYYAEKDATNKTLGIHTSSQNGNYDFVYMGQNYMGEDEAMYDFHIPEGTTKIAAGAFKDCKYLNTVTIPSSVTTIESGAFNNCQILKEIIFEGSSITPRPTKNNISTGCPSYLKLVFQ